MVDWGTFFTGVASGAIAVSSIVFFWANGLITLKSLLPDRAKPKVLEPPNCGIRVTPLEKEVHCILLVNNSGSKNCSIISRDLIALDGHSLKLGYDSSSTPLPKTISKDSTEKVVIKGSVSLKELPIEPKQKSVDIKVIIKFDTKHIIEKTFAFIISYYIQPKY